MMNVLLLELSKISHIHESISCVACEFMDVGQGSGNLRIKEDNSTTLQHHRDPLYHSHDLEANLGFQLSLG
jgi:hypothetical protein